MAQTIDAALTGAASSVRHGEKTSPQPTKSNAEVKSTEHPMLAAAQALGGRGFRVFQIKPGGNTPLTEGWQSKASTVPKGWPLNANIGIATGDGLLVVDIDPRNGGVESIENFQLAGYELPETLTADTPSGGKHFFYRAPAELYIKSSANEIAPGVDIKASGGYVVAAPSKRKGGAYKWANTLPIADAPQWLLDHPKLKKQNAAERRARLDERKERTASVEITPFQQKALDYVADYFKQRPLLKYGRGAWCEKVMLPLYGAGLIDVARDHCGKAPNGDADAADDFFANEERAGTVARASLETVVSYARELGFDEPDAAIADLFDVVTPSTFVVAVNLPTGLKLRSQKDGRRLAEIANVLAALRADACTVGVRHDQFRDELMLAPRGTDEWRACRDTDVTALQEAFERAGFKPISREIMRNALHKIGEEQSFDSAIHWLNTLQWDGQHRVGAFLHEYFRAEDSEYTRAVSSYLWTALAGRVLDPGCQTDMVPVLVGDQGRRKSSALAAMVPAPEHFTGFGFEKISHPDTSRRMRGVLLGEIAELKGINSRDIEAIKDWITRRYERWTPKYQEFDATFPRRLVFVGTTNSAEFLADKTGNRRWLPVAVGQADRDAIDRDRGQLWAEARQTFQASGIAWQEAERLAPTVHDEYAISDSWEDAISEWLSQPADFDDLTRDGKPAPRSEYPFTIVDLLRGALGFQASAISKAPEMRAAEILRELGFTRKVARVNGQPRRVWSRKCAPP